FWLFEGMPEGDADFGKNFFCKQPNHPTVFRVINQTKNNGLNVTHPSFKNELDTFRSKINSHASNGELLEEFYQLSEPTQTIIKHCIWVKAGRPLDKGPDFSGNVIRAHPRNHLVVEVINKLNQIIVS